MALGISVRCDETGQSDLEEILTENNFEFLRAKTNIGIGRADLTATPLA